MVYLGLWKGRSKEERLELVWIQSGEIFQTGRQWIPDRWSDKTETALTKRLQITLIFLAMSTFSPVGSRSSNGMRMCVCGWNELEICTTLAYPHISSFCTMPVPQAHTHTHPQTIWGQWTDGAKSGYCQKKIKIFSQRVHGVCLISAGQRWKVRQECTVEMILHESCHLVLTEFYRQPMHFIYKWCYVVSLMFLQNKPLW